MKSKRKIVVEEQEYIWTLENNDLTKPGRWITVTQTGTSWSRLYIDPYPWGLEIKPSSISKAIRRAKDLGWDPSNKTPDMRLTFKEGSFKEI